LHQRAEQPFEPGALHPGRRLTQRSCVEIEGSAYADERNTKLSAMRECPALLARAAKPNEYNAGAACQNAADLFGILGRRQWTKGRRDIHSDRQPWDVLGKSIHESVENL